MTLRVVQWGVGTTGRTGLQGIIGHPGLELVGLVVQRPENIGRDAGELCNRPRTGILASGSVEDALALKPDCLAYFGSGVEDPVKGVEVVARFLEAGINVVNTSLPTLTHPRFAPEPLRRRLADACRKGGASIFTTGIEPGFASDLLPMVLLSGADRIEELRVFEIRNYAAFPNEYLQREVMGLGMPMDRESILMQGETMTDAWGGVVRGLAAAIGVELDGLRQWHESGATSIDVKTAFGLVPAGTRGGVRLVVEGMYGDRPIVALEHINYVTEELPAHWRRAKLGQHTGYRIELTGRPSAEIEMGFGLTDGEEHAVIATAMRAINAIPAVVDAPAGPLEPHQVPPIVGGNVRDR